MNSKETPGIRRWVWLVSGLLLLFLVASAYGVARSLDETLPLSSPGVRPSHPEEHVPAVNVAPEIDVGRLSESLAQALNRHLDQWIHRNREELKESRLMQIQSIEEWKEELGGEIKMQSSRLAELNQRLHLIEGGINRLLETLEDEALEPPMEPMFVFRGIEIWHGQIYALLEHEGQIMPVREGESRLGWRIHAIDRDGRKLHVSDGMQEHILEVQ